MKVYLVWHDNGETWEDAYCNLERIFASREAAIDYITESGYTKESNGHFSREHVKTQPCVKGLTYEEYFDDVICQMCKLAYCPHEEYDMTSYENSFEFIEEREVIES